MFNTIDYIIESIDMQTHNNTTNFYLFNYSCRKTEIK